MAPTTWITTKEAAEYSGYDIQYLRRLIRRKVIEARKFGPVYQVSKESLLAYIQKAKSAKDKRYRPKKRRT